MEFRKRNPWVPAKQMGSVLDGFNISDGIKVMLMGYGVYCLISKGVDFVKDKFGAKPPPVHEE